MGVGVREGRGGKGGREGRVHNGVVYMPMRGEGEGRGGGGEGSQWCRVSSACRLYDFGGHFLPVSK